MSFPYKCVLVTGALAEQMLDYGSLVSKYCNLDAALLNAGSQHRPDILHSSAALLSRITSELHTNYLSPLRTSILLLAHFQKRSTAVIFVSSGCASWR
ncbi:NAD(P)-binding domain protein [Metarhizium rileyi]|uniref:NAD(P)-binding domain protein n=1 Tax=Metarhizium rileyi (strain RCEF 4871) TaxID=1649241 RepID=A0A167E114_METRR|nr:NAD(P)-binding domain protein [Metarhizium rileyi RCEF 4871]